MQNYYDAMIREVDKRIESIDLNGTDIIKDCKKIITFLKEKLSELKPFMDLHPFQSESEEIEFFKCLKPKLLGPLIYFYEILRIETGRPLNMDMLDEYYMKHQKEQKLFFDRHITFFQYYRGGSTYLDNYYFLRGNKDNQFDIDVCHFDDMLGFSTGYDNLVARIMAMEMLYAFLSARRTCLQQKNGIPIELLKTKGTYRWTGSAIELAELVYALDEMGCINDGEAPIHELSAFIGTLLGVNIRDCYSAYTDMKRRKNTSRTYFLDKMRDKLNKRMDRDDDKEQ